MARNRKRKIIIVIATVLLGIVLIIVALPLWFPLVADRIAKHYGVTFSGYERLGYSRIAFSNVGYETTNVTFTAKNVAVLQPTTWLWKHYVTGSRSGEFATVNDWSLNFDKRTGAKRRKVTPATVMQRTDRAVAELRTWIPGARFTDGVMRYEGNEVNVPLLIWKDGKINSTVLSPRHEPTAKVEANLAQAPKTLAIELADLKLQATIHSDADVVKLDGTARWLTNHAEITAEFTQSWIPSTATASAQHFRVPADMLRLEGYEDLIGRISAQWQSNRYVLDLEAEAQPAASSQLTPINVVLSATGSTNRVRFETATVSTPWLRAVLSSGVEFDYSGKLLSPAAAIAIEADLSKQELVDATGRFSGRAFLTRSVKKYPFARFTLTSSGFNGYGLDLEELKLDGTLDWPLLHFSTAKFRLADGATGEAQTVINMVSRHFDSGTLRLRGPLGREFLPHEVSYTNIVADVEFSGSLREPAHLGTLKVSGLSLPNMKTLSATAQWRAKFREIETFEAEAIGKNASLRLAGSATLQTNGAALSLSKLTVETAASSLLEMQQPTTIGIAKKRVEIGDLLLQGREREVAIKGTLSWPQSGKLAGSARNLRLTEFQGFFADRLSDLDFDELQFSGSWTNGPLDFVLKLKGQFTPVETNRLSLQINASGDERGLSFENVSVLSDSGPVLNARGFFPGQFIPAEPTNKFKVQPEQLIDIRLDTAPNAVFWDRVARWSHIRLKEPSVHAVVSGTLESPKGKIVAQVAEASWDDKKIKLPSLTKVNADMELTEQMVRLNRLDMLFEGQPITAEAKLPLGDLSRTWQQVFDWRKASGRVRADGVELAPFRKYIPDILAPQGRLDLNVAFAPGMLLDGWLIIEDAATRPLPGSGPLHDLKARLHFTNHTVELKNVQGLLGGQPVGIFGKVDFSKSRNNLPIMDLALLAQSVPLARRPDAIIRGDLNLKLSNLTNDVPVVFGEVRLRDSYYLGDIKQLVPGRVASPKRRPPYFSVNVAPFNEWLANVHVTGENFLNVRSPLFRGKISANWRITGTLGEPIALGDAEIESGTIQFPFANFQVTRGFMTLTSEDPYRPEMFATATSRAFGYDLQMTLSGPANAPIIEFNATPALTSEQVIAMVTTGEVPNRTFGFSEEQRAQRVALFLGRSLISKFGDPAGAERLTVSTGEEISDEGQATYGLEYKITDDWSVVGEYDRFGAVNVGVKWRIYSK